nr:hypothetical protein [Streptococcus equi]
MKKLEFDTICLTRPSAKSYQLQQTRAQELSSTSLAEMMCLFF